MDDCPKFWNGLTLEDKNILITKLRYSNFFTPQDVIIIKDDIILWKNSCPSCGKDMDFSFGDFQDEYLDGTQEIEYMAFCVDKECSGHIDNNGIVC